MRRRRVLALLGLAPWASRPALGGEAPGSPGKVLSPDDAIASEGDVTKTVRFRVANAGVLTGLQGEGMPPHLSPLHLVSAPLRGGGEFHVYINGKLLEDLDRLAIARAGDFSGSVVQVTGTIRKLDAGAGKGADYQMVALDLEKFRVVERPPR